MADYATTAELKAEIGKTTAGDDATLALLVTAASRAIDAYCNRPDGFVAVAVATARYYPGSGLAHQWIDECTEVTAVAVKDSMSDDEGSYVAWTLGAVGTTLDADVFPATGGPQRPMFNRTPYTMLIVGPNGSYSKFTSGKYGDTGLTVQTVKVTAKWGYAVTVPPAVKQACIMQVGRWYKRLKSSMADALTTMELGQLVYTKKVDPDVELILKLGRLVRPIYAAV